MAKVVKEIPPVKSARRMYPWGKWLDGRVWQLTHGKDFVSKPNGMSQQVYAAAKKMGIKATTVVRGKNVYLKAHTPKVVGGKKLK